MAAHSLQTFLLESLIVEYLRVAPKQIYESRCLKTWSTIVFDLVYEFNTIASGRKLKVKESVQIH